MTFLASGVVFSRLLCVAPGASAPCLSQANPVQGGWTTRGGPAASPSRISALTMPDRPLWTGFRVDAHAVSSLGRPQGGGVAGGVNQTLLGCLRNCRAVSSCFYKPFWRESFGLKALAWGGRQAG